MSLIRSLNVPALKALVWDHSMKCKASDDPGVLAQRCIDPSTMTKPLLLVHLRDTLRLSANSQVQQQTLDTATATWESIKDDPKLIADALQLRRPPVVLLPPVVPPPPSPPSLSMEDQRKAARLSLTSLVDEEEEFKESESSKRRRINSDDETPRSVVFCCGCKKRQLEHLMGNNCNQCGRSWFDPPSSSSSSSTASVSSASSSSSSLSSSVEAAPVLAYNKAAVMSNAIAQAVSRVPDQYDIAPLSPIIIQKARNGKRQYTLHELMPTRARDAHAGQREDDLFLRFTTASNTLSLTDDDHGPSAANKRSVQSMSDMAEVIFHVLIGVIFPDDSDLCKQYMGLFSIATDIARQHGFDAALHYASSVRDRHWRTTHQPSTGPTAPAQSIFSMADYHQDHLPTGAPLPRTSSAPLSSTSTGGASQRSAKPGQVCYNYNEGRCVGYCGRQHVCRTCRVSGHIMSSCPQIVTPPVLLSLPAPQHPKPDPKVTKRRSG
jgi:hypothetical protein